MTAMLKRNLKLYFRDRTSVFFSLLSVFIIVGLYAFFLGDVMVRGTSFAGAQGVKWMMDSWLMAGVLATSAVTTALGALGTMVEDKSHKIDMDFVTSPMKRSEIIGAYVLGGLCVSLIMTCLAGLAATFYILVRGGELISIARLVQVLGIVILSAFSGTALVLFMVSFVQTSNAFSVVSTLIGTLIGFLAGIYMPIGQLPRAMQTVISFVPTAHSAALLRQTMMAEPMQRVFSLAPPDMVLGFRKMMGVDLYFGDTIMSPAFHYLVLAGTGIVLFALSTLNLRRKKR